MTGSPAAPRSGENTLTVSQSSGSASGAAGDIGVTRTPDCGGGGPNAVASRVPSQGRAGRGAANRRSPTGGWANGMPRKTAMSAALRRPRTRPLAVRTTGSVTSMHAPLVPRGPRAGPDLPVWTRFAARSDVTPRGRAARRESAGARRLARDGGQGPAEETVEGHRRVRRAQRVDRRISGDERVALVVHDR